MLDIRVAVAKLGRTSSATSSDTLEVIERPGGGVSLVLVDGSGTGRGAKSLSSVLAMRVIALLSDGARDEAAAQAIHDYLYTYRMGQSSATLNIISVDFAEKVLRVTRNNPAPFYVLTPRGLHTYNEPSTPIGLHDATLPVVHELPVEPYTSIVAFTDGLLHAGERYQEDTGLTNFLAGWPVGHGSDPEELTDEILARAIEADHGEPVDDISIVTLAVHPAYPPDDDQYGVYPVRRLTASVPFEPDEERQDRINTRRG